MCEQHWNTYTHTHTHRGIRTAYVKHELLDMLDPHVLSPYGDSRYGNPGFKLKQIQILKNKISDFSIKIELPDFSLLGGKFGVF